MRVHVDALESAMGVKFRDKSAVESAMMGIVSCCGDDGESEMEDGEEKGQGKGLSIGMILGRKK